MEKIALDSNLFAKKVAAKEIFGSNLLLLQNKLVRVPDLFKSVGIDDKSQSFRASAPNSSALAGENQWDALCASHALGSSVSFSTKLEPPLGFEPRTFSLQKSCSTTELRWRNRVQCNKVNIRKQRTRSYKSEYPWRNYFTIENGASLTSLK